MNDKAPDSGSATTATFEETASDDASGMSAYADQVRLLYSNSHTGLAVNVLLSFTMTWLLWESVPRQMLLIWLVVLLALTAVRVFSLRRFIGTAPGDLKIRSWGRKFLVFSTISGLVWGLSAAWFASQVAADLQLFLAFAVGGMASGAAAVLGAQKRVYFPYLFGIMLPLTVWFFWQEEYRWRGMGLMLAIYTLAMVMTGFIYCRLVVQSISLAQQLNVEKRRAESANKAKSIFVANMSHEIRTPLNGVLGMLDLLLESGMNARQQHQAQVAKRSAKSLLGVIEDVLDFSKIEAGRMQISIGDFDLQALLGECHELMSEQARSKNLHMRLSAPSESLMVRGDSVKLHQVLVNLMSNAIKFTDAGEIHTTLEILDTHEGGRSIRFAVKDSGRGIDAGDVQRIFRSFEQADSSRTRLHGGTGLGLSISRQLVELMGGNLECTSQPGVGTCFEFTLQLQDAMATPEPNPVAHPQPVVASEATQDRSRPILLVEDNRVNQEVAVYVLETLGYVTEVAADGQEALDCVRNGDYGLLFMDCHMPNLDGFEATRAIRSLEQEQGRQPLAIVAMTADVQLGVVENCRAAGMDDYLSKPFDMDSVRSAVEKWYRGSPAIPSILPAS
ncbi:MAG: ATP-binding protein [Congregibacter sp.]